MTFLLSPLEEKRHIAVTILLSCMCMRASIWICTGHNFYICGWISKLFDTVVVLEEEKCHVKHFLGRLKVKVTLKGHIN